MTKHTPTPWLTWRAESGNWHIDSADFFVAEVRARNGRVDAPYIVRAVNAHAALVEALEHFHEWHANHFDDFSSDINAQLLCLANETEAALKLAKE